ncbi:endo-1,4-beta-xylanase [Coleofasciculus sp.]|uniref:endo-1,4-beta-xylanase n=1 Tax=Coleofasciculus sp. TaxID=3100458 RepID=UPI0039F84BE5
MINYLGGGVDALKFKRDKRYREVLLENFNCLYPQNAFKFDVTCGKDLSFSFEKRDAFLTKLPEGFAYRINCLFWDYSMLKRLSVIPVGERWRFLEEWIKRLLAPVGVNCVGIDVVNEPFRIVEGRAVSCSLGTILGDDWIECSLSLVKSIRPDLDLFVCQHQVAHKSIQIALKLLAAKKLPEVNFALQCTSSFFAVDRFDISKFIDTLPGTIHIPEVTVWRYRIGDRPVHSIFKEQKYWQKKQIKAYIQLIGLLLQGQNIELIGFWEPCLGRTFYYQDDEPGFLDTKNGIMNEELKNLFKNEFNRTAWS